MKTIDYHAIIAVHLKNLNSLGRGFFTIRMDDRNIMLLDHTRNVSLFCYEHKDIKKFCLKVHHLIQAFRYMSMSNYTAVTAKKIYKSYVKFLKSIYYE